MTPEALLDALEVVGDAPDGVERLRDLIRQMAIEGLLTIAEREDRSATDLLKSIAVEKHRLMKAKVIRKPRSLPRDDPRSIFGNLPPNWSAAWLADCVSYDLTDGDWVESKDQDPDGEIRLTQLADVGVGVFKDVSERFLNEQTAERLRCTPLQLDDVLIARLPRPLGRACTFPGALQTCVTVVDVAIARPGNHSVLSHFLVLYLNSPEARKRIAGLATGTTRQCVSTGNLRKLPVRVPPLAEQHRIVAKVDELMDLLDAFEKARDERDARRTALRDSALASLQNAEDADAVHTAWTRIAANLDTLFTNPADIAPLRQTILQLAVRGRLVKQDPEDEPASEFLQTLREKKAAEKIREGQVGTLHGEESLKWEIPELWQWVPFGETHLNFDGNRVPLRSADRQQRQGPYPYYGASGVIDTIDDYLFDGDFLLIGEDGANLVNRATPIAFVASGKFWVNNHAHVLGSVDSGSLRYLGIFVNSIDLKPHLTGIAQPKLNQRRMNMIPTPVPPLAEQHRIVAKVDELMAICDELEQRLTEARDTQAAFAAAAVHHLDVGQWAARQDFETAQATGA